MRKFVQVHEGKAWWVFEDEEMPKFSPDITIEDITDVITQPQEGWDFNEETRKFSPPKDVHAPSLVKVEDQLAQLRQDNLTLMEGLVGVYEMLLQIGGE